MKENGRTDDASRVDGAATNAETCEPTIEVSGVRFTALQVKSAVVTIDNRDVTIGERTDKKKPLGFGN